MSQLPTEVFLAYEQKIKDTLNFYVPDAPYAVKNAILVTVCKAWLSGKASNGK